MTSYDGFASVYDEVLGRRYHAAVVPRLLKEFRRADLFPPGRILDAGCGSGMLAAFLKDRGFTAFALDLSLGMLRPGRDRGLAVFQASMRAFALRAPVDAVLCLYDSINHLLDPAAVRAAFACFHAALRPGGRLIMDTNNAWAFRHVFGSPRPYETEFEGGSIRMETSFDPASGLARARVTGSWRGERVEDELAERYYPRADLRRWLHEAGFRSVRAEGWSPGRAYGGREVKDFWSARRR
jgi:SAM-dependent methyltransferase